MMIAELEFYTLIGYYKCNWLRPESDERLPATVPDFFHLFIAKLTNYTNI